MNKITKGILIFAAGTMTVGECYELAEDGAIEKKHTHHADHGGQLFAWGNGYDMAASGNTSSPVAVLGGMTFLKYE